jgi:hypothetical protein
MNPISVRPKEIFTTPTLLLFTLKKVPLVRNALFEVRANLGKAANFGRSDSEGLFKKQLSFFQVTDRTCQKIALANIRST